MNDRLPRVLIIITKPVDVMLTLEKAGSSSEGSLRRGAGIGYAVRSVYSSSKVARTVIRAKTSCKLVLAKAQNPEQ